MDKDFLSSIGIEYSDSDQLAHEVVLEFYEVLTKTNAPPGSAEWNDEIERLRRAYVRRTNKSAREAILKRVAIVNVVADLLRQGWNFESQATTAAKTRMGERELRRLQLVAQRTEQLRTLAVQSFVRKMERPHWFEGRRVSIFSLMRDGRELADSLMGVQSGRIQAEDVIKPYLQFVESDTTCEYTGIPLSDIWRYFRLTWTNPYQSVPGRSMTFLLRDAATPLHTVMGIGCLSSSAVKLRNRDDFIGWEAEKVLQEFPNISPTRTNAWLESVIENRLGEIYKVDFIEDELITPKVLENPTEAVIATLREEASKRRTQHHRVTDPEDHKAVERSPLTTDYWVKQSMTPLFRSKRAVELANLLWARKIVRSFLGGGANREAIRRLVAAPDGKKAIADLVRLAKAVRVGTAIADLTVCGAIPPYNPLVVGKLVAMLAVSPEAILANRARYCDSPSVIASSMAGRPIVRPADLVFVGTTSLYGELPCQYSSISIPAQTLGGKLGQPIKYRYIDNTVGWGTYQFSQETMRAITGFLKSTRNGQRVNYIFGEGANPKMRALRDGLAALGFNEEALLRHGQQKAMFGVNLVSNLKEYLLGQESRPKYLFSLKAPNQSSQNLINWWAGRWLLKRIAKPGVLDDVRRHTLVHPIEHGARVRLPVRDVEQTNLLI
ncbi:MAG TPA: Druantia anti-phage system protein DruA [Thermoanaerobaculia bacterium]|jgi:hypothetical protein|nr:Druantia anti-phage system protein DruA [Thermoanaerobaculia bacterium]